jgi:S-DNA-T family DNA segregation ATPase FtsK/SpoIIIE
VGHQDLTEFQAARIGGRRPRLGGPAVSIRAVRWIDLGEVTASGEDPRDEEDTTDLAVLVDAVNQAAKESGIPAPQSPWLPALPEQLVLDPSVLRSADGETPAPALFGLEDLPDQQAQRYAPFDPVRDGHLIVIGDPGSGRSTLLRTLAGALAARNRVADVHLYAIDCGNGALLPLGAFPHMGAVVTRHEPDRVDRLIGKLLNETTERQQLLARRGFATIADQRRMCGPEDRLPYIVVLLDRWEGFMAEFDTIDGGRLVNSLMHLMREGPGAGIRVVVTADRSATTPRFSSLAERILMLRLNDRTVYSVLGLNPRYLPDHMPPGRGFYTRGGTEVQVGLLAGDPSGPAQVAAIERLAADAAAGDADPACGRRPDPIAVLPLHVSLTGLLSQLEDHPSHGPRILVGVGGDRLTPQEVDLGTHGPGFVISGPPRSGRSNALVTVARSLVRRGGQVIAIWSRPSPIGDLAGPGVRAVINTKEANPADLAAILGEGGPDGLTVLVDDAELVSDSPLSDGLAGFVRGARDHRAALVLAGTAGELNGFRGFIPEARKSRSGLLLCPPATEGETLGIRLPRTAVFSGPPGRGVLVVNGEISTIQVPLNDPVSEPLETGRIG